MSKKASKPPNKMENRQINAAKSTVFNRVLHSDVLASLLVNKSTVLATEYPLAFPVRCASMVPGWILKVSSTIATIGATVVKESTIPNRSRMIFCGLEKYVLILFRTITILLVFFVAL